MIRKQVSEWLKELPDYCRDEAIREFEKQKTNDCPAMSTKEALFSAFDFVRSNRGSGYWFNIADRLDNPYVLCNACTKRDSTPLEFIVINGNECCIWCGRDIFWEDKYKETEGVRQNAGKPMFSPIDPDLLLECAKGLSIGQEKYKDKAFNKKGNIMLLSTGYDSLMRHLHKYMAGEDIDPDDDVHHLAKVINCAVVMWHNRVNGDDRK